MICDRFLLVQFIKLDILGLPKPHHVKEVFEGSAGLLAGLKQGQIWIDHSTTDHEQNKVNIQILFFNIFKNSNRSRLHGLSTIIWYGPLKDLKSLSKKKL